MDPPMHADLCGLYRIELIVHGRSWTGQIENFIDFDVERETYVMAHQLEARIRQQMMHVASRPGVEIIDAQNFVAAFQQAIAKVPINPAPPVTRTRRSDNIRKPSGSSRRRVYHSCEPCSRLMSGQSACDEVFSSAVRLGRLVNQSATAVSWSHTTLASRVSPERCGIGVHEK